MLSRLLAILSGLLVLTMAIVARADDFITVASTTSTQNSGLFDEILPIFTEESGIQVRVVAVGTGAAIKLARNGDADVLLVHHKPSEQAFVRDGYGLERFDVMYNDFVLVGPKSDPAQISVEQDVIQALKKISAAQVSFASRGDDSGTHKKEMGLWKLAGIDPQKHSGTWYRETGSGMGATLNVAAAMNAYALSDRGTWLSFKNRDGLKILSEGDSRLFNQYGVIMVNPARHPHVKRDMAQLFIDWLVSERGQGLIDGFRINGEKLFNGNAR